MAKFFRHAYDIMRFLLFNESGMKEKIRAMEAQTAHIEAQLAVKQAQAEELTLAQLRSVVGRLKLLERRLGEAEEDAKVLAHDLFLRAEGEIKGAFEAMEKSLDKERVEKRREGQQLRAAKEDGQGEIKGLMSVGDVGTAGKR